MLRTPPEKIDRIFNHLNKPGLLRLDLDENNISVHGKKHQYRALRRTIKKDSRNRFSPDKNQTEKGWKLEGI